jgi:prephenate dehydrogenase
VAEGDVGAGKDRLESFWRSLGAEPASIDAETHDRMMAWVSHLPQLTANALGRILAEAGFTREELGTGGRDMTRLAGSAPEMWTDLFSSAPEDLPGALAAMETALGDLRRLLDAGELREIAEWMARTRAWSEGERWS